LISGLFAQASPTVSRIEAVNASAGSCRAHTNILKGGIEALAFGDRHLDEVVELLGAEALGAAQRDGVAKHRQPFLGPQIEVAEPHLLVISASRP